MQPVLSSSRSIENSFFGKKLRSCRPTKAVCEVRILESKADEIKRVWSS